ncbi:MAG: [FeFe] hydrogenase H-cluster radical SAM maturase HydG, partial [Planctomycetes bacterium]|nr:[FeFe] hydrogenase H-cluster radical SAM maturase HydG [Planctomycetota bacterium]
MTTLLAAPKPTTSFIDEAEIECVLDASTVRDAARVREVLAKAEELGGLELADIPPLMAISDPALLDELFATARKVKEAIYGRRLVVFAPLYIS